MAKFSAQEIFSIASPHTLTKEQVAAIEHEGGSALVVAGAGSGKTELMSIRAMYLVANQLALPNEILGLTFTRKAATELAFRVNQGLFALRESKFWPEQLGDDFQPPKIATYNSFGNEIFRDLALELGYESDSLLLGEAGAVSLAKELLKNLDLEQFPNLMEFDRTESYLISLVLAAAAQLTDNLVTATEAQSKFQDFINLATGLPQKPGGSSELFAYTKSYVAQAELNQLVFELAGKYRNLKAERNLVDFSDQVALALEAVSHHEIRLDYRHIMLDEYQDTSSIQTMLLARLFGQESVMAVGDPNQSIYGWRGASSANLENFAKDFNANGSYALSRSWRSSHQIVAAANCISEPLISGGISPVKLLAGRDFPDLVTARVFQDESEEALEVANWLKAELDSESTAAILFRSKSSMHAFASALDDQGIEYEVTGLSGLIEQPEVVDLVAALRVMIDPEAGSHLMRLLAGPRFRIAPRDIAKLSGYARLLSKFRKSGYESPISLVEALDEIRFAKDLSLAEFSAEAERRLRSASELIHRMRQSVGLSLTELAWNVVRELELDIELFAYSRSKNPLGNLQSFISRISDYEQSANRPSLSGLVSWLDYAIEHESFELPKAGVKKGVVQLMTIHAAKGLEWDYVAVVGLVEGSFPVGPKDTIGWLAPGRLPFALRRDGDFLPKLNLEVESQKELDANVKQFKTLNRTHQLNEERRLAYVAITRASRKLLLTAAYFKPGIVKPRPIAGFMQELLAAAVARLDFEIPEPLEQNPSTNLNQVASWPFDPLGENRPAVELAAQQVLDSEPESLESSLELVALIEEQQQPGFAQLPELPHRLSASKIVQLLTNPEDFYQQLLRPMPQPFSRSAQVGSNFHATLEEAFMAGSELDLETWAEEIKELGQNFMNSPFADMKPMAVELPFEFALAETIVVCKLDAVFEQDGGYQIVDWKSGKAPSAEDLEERSIQLALYRIGLAKLFKVGVEKISASFYFAKDNSVVSPKLVSEAELVKALAELRKVPRP